VWPNFYFEFVIYTNSKTESKSPLEGEESDPLRILRSATGYRKYIISNKTGDRNVFGFFEQYSIYNTFIKKLDNLLKWETSVNKEINLKVRNIQNSVCYKEISGNLNCLKSNLN
jgi:flagellar biosynthesis chaperone FliJ